MRLYFTLAAVLLLTVASGYFLGVKGFETISFFEAKRLLSPIEKDLVNPNLTSNLSNSFSNASNLWTLVNKTSAGGPQTSVILGDKTPPEISAESAILVDLTSNSIIFEKNSKFKRPIASTLKIMTAFVALERAKPQDLFTISQNAATAGEDFMGVSVGEKYSFEDLLYGLMLPSGNDSAIAIAENTAGSVDKFVDLMNQKAKLLGLSDTKFVNPTGLEGDGEHYSTASDLSVIARNAYKSFPLLQRVVATPDYEIPYSDSHKYLYLENQTNLLTSYPGVKGFKPGYTPEAGLCLVTIADIDGHEVLGIVLGSVDRRFDMTVLLDFAKEIL